MSFLGWLVMSVSVLTVVGLFAWCIHKVYTIPEEAEHVHGFEQDPPDVTGD